MLKTLRFALCLLLLATLLLPCIPLPSTAATYTYSLCLNEGNVHISGSSGGYLTIEHGNKTYEDVSPAASIRVYGTGKATSNIIRISGEATVDLTIDGVRIVSSNLRAPIQIRNNLLCKICLHRIL